ncbi:unnamed protein product, partial [Polarella glacialis]
KFGGSISGVPAHVLGAEVIKALLADTGGKVSPDMVEEVIIGQVLTAGVGQCPARQTVILAGLPVTCPALTINKVCGSGLKALHLAAQAIASGEASVVIAGGQESMSSSPHVLPKSRDGQRMGDWKLTDTMIKDGLWCAFNDYHMGVTAENIAAQFGVDRQAQDEFAAASQQKAAAAQKAGKFQEQIVPVASSSKKAPAFAVDEYVKADASVQQLQKLKPAFKKDRFFANWSPLPTLKLNDYEYHETQLQDFEQVALNVNDNINSIIDDYRISNSPHGSDTSPFRELRQTFNAAIIVMHYDKHWPELDEVATNFAFYLAGAGVSYDIFACSHPWTAAILQKAAPPG